MRLILHAPPTDIALRFAQVADEFGHRITLAIAASDFLDELRDDREAIGLFYQDGWINGVELAHEVRTLGLNNLLFAVLDLPSYDNDRTAIARARVLDAGADDVQVWPVAPEEIGSRIEALSRRTRVREDLIRIPGGAFFDPDGQVVFTDDISVHLATSESLLLEALAARPMACITKAVCMSVLYGGRDEAQSKIIDVFICKLRKKLVPIVGDRQVIETLWGQGYRFNPTPARAAA